MKTLPAGHRKYLLIDDTRVIANASRHRAASPIVVVVEELLSDDGTSYIEHRADNVVVEGPVSLAYAQHRPLVKMHRRTVRAAYMTTGAVILSESPDEIATLPAAPPADPPAKPKKATSKK